jgi:hypothetical protein
MAATAAVVVVAGATAYSANQQHEAQNSAQRQARAQQRTLLAQQEADRAALANQPKEPAQAARRRIAGASGRADTILTGPLGLQGSASGSYQPKTLLGQ